VRRVLDAEVKNGTLRLADSAWARRVRPSWKHAASATGAWLGMKKSLQAADGNQGFLFLIVVQSLVGSYVAWYGTHYGLPLLLPPSIRFSSWYAWIALVVPALASAAVQPPLFIGFSLLADESSRNASDAQTPSPCWSCCPLSRF
jgi:hypothetical protein